jgi:hypothetical protein
MVLNISFSEMSTKYSRLGPKHLHLYIKKEFIDIYPSEDEESKCYDLSSDLTFRVWSEGHV